MVAVGKPRVIIVDNDPDVTNLLAGVFRLKRLDVFKSLFKKLHFCPSF